MIYKEMVIHAGIRDLPHVGEPLAHQYFTHANQGRFEKLEQFYERVREILRDSRDSSLISQHADSIGAEVIALIERIHGLAEMEPQPEKLDYLAHFYRTLLVDPIAGDYDTRLAFLNALSSMTLSECKLLESLANHRDCASAQDEDPDAWVDAVQQLRLRGLVSTEVSNAGRRKPAGQAREPAITARGARFAQLALNTPNASAHVQWQRTLIKAA